MWGEDQRVGYFLTSNPCDPSLWWTSTYPGLIEKTSVGQLGFGKNLWFWFLEYSRFQFWFSFSFFLSFQKWDSVFILIFFNLEGEFHSSFSLFSELGQFQFVVPSPLIMSILQFYFQDSKHQNSQLGKLELLFHKII
jgi:hypothetical protein